MEYTNGRKTGDAEVLKFPRVVFRETFTGNGSATEFTLTNTPDNATFKVGSWDAGDILNTLPAHITKTNKGAAYDSLIPVSRNRIGVSSISTTTGVVTLDYAPRAIDFYIWYWYEPDQSVELEDYYREDFVTSMETVASSVPSLPDLDSSHSLKLIWNENDTANRLLNLLVSGGDRSLTLEGDTKLNQDLTTDANVTFAGLITTAGRTVGTTRIINTDSPYTLLSTDHKVYCDTDAGAITVLLSAGTDGRSLTIKNVGSSDNDMTITPDGAELFFGDNASEDFVDGEVIDMQYETTEGWY